MSAQLSNLDLESWTDAGGYDNPDGWMTVNDYAALLGIAEPVEKLTTSVSQGLAAAKMTTLDCASCGTFGVPDPLPGLLNQDIAYYSNPVSVNFDYQYAGVSGDWGAVIVQLTEWDPVGDSAKIVAQAVDTISDMATWTNRSVDFIYSAGTFTPDSLKIYFVASISAIIADPSFPAAAGGSALSIDAVEIVDPATSGIATNNNLEAKVYVSNNNINVMTSEVNNTDVNVVDITGKVIYSSALRNNSTQIPTNGMSSGIYFVTLNGNGKRFVQKVIIE